MSMDPRTPSQQWPGVEALQQQQVAMRKALDREVASLTQLAQDLKIATTADAPNSAISPLLLKHQEFVGRFVNILTEHSQLLKTVGNGVLAATKDIVKAMGTDAPR